MFAWGSTVNGELGIGGVENENVFSPVQLQWSGANRVSDVACGSNHTLLLTVEGKVFSCGNNDYGQLGHDQPRKRPHEVSGLDAFEIMSIACGTHHSMALNQWGQLFTWGSDSFGQLGHQLGSTIQAVPKIVKALTSLHIIQIACGQKHSIALTNCGDILTWGANSYGQLGLGSTTTYEANPTIIRCLIGMPLTFIACGGNHTFALSKSGAVYGWGKNTSGQLGLNDTVSKALPTQLRTLRTIHVRYVNCGEDFSTFLTLDGGVFTCGAGMYGQLGHGSMTNEILPRKVLELMGSTITQVQCGRQHTLALVPSRGRVYSFGLGGVGQLGCKKTGNASTPQIVAGPWITSSTTSEETALVICKIFAGGDHCFARVENTLSTAPAPYDSRNLPPLSQIVTLNYEMMHKCLAIEANTVVDLDILSYLETVFKSLSVINGSFLLNPEGQYMCTSKNHGVDFDMAEKTFSIIGRLENQTLKDVIWSTITETLLANLVKNPPDVEVLRIYLILPFYHEFNNPKQHQRLHRPFASSLLNLNTQAARVVGTWWSTTPHEFFEKLVNVFKSVALYIIRSQNLPRNKSVTDDPSLHTMLEILGLLNKLNHNFEGLKVPYDTFHLNDLSEYLDIRVDYISWLTDSSNKFYLCNYPFIFDAEIKTQLLETDQSIQMQSAMNQAAQQAFYALLLQPSYLHVINQFLVLNVTRENIVEDSLRELSSLDARELKKPLRVKFHGEEAEDAGGVSKEFFMLLLREILDPKYGMFKEYEETRAIWFSGDSFEDEIMYFLIGLICGLAIYNFTIINIPFPLVLYKKLLKEPVALMDLKGLTPTIANSLQSLLEYSEPDLEDVFNLTFEISRDVYGDLVVIPLKPNGQNIAVTQENKQEYINLYVDYILNKSVAAHYESFSSGFMKVCGGRVLELFHSHELMAVVVGNENYDWHALEEVAQYKNGYKSSDEVIRWFWEVLHDMSLQDKKKFLLFLTGSDRIPMQGMKAIKIVVQPTNDEKFLPVAHTCFNMLDLPRYKTKERLKYKLLQAIQQTQGFSLV